MSGGCGRLGIYGRAHSSAADQSRVATLLRRRAARRRAAGVRRNQPLHLPAWHARTSNCKPGEPDQVPGRAAGGHSQTISALASRPPPRDTCMKGPDLRLGELSRTPFDSRRDPPANATCGFCWTWASDCALLRRSSSTSPDCAAQSLLRASQPRQFLTKEKHN